MQLKVHVAIVARAVPTARYPLNGIFEWDQAKALVAAGVTVDYLAVDLRSFRRIRPWGITHGEKEGIKWHSISIPIGALPRLVCAKIGAWALKKLYRNVFSGGVVPDILHAHFEEFGYMTAVLSDAENIPFVVTEHSSDILEKEISKEYLYILRESHIKAKRVISVSNILKKSIYDHTGVIAEVIPNIIADDFVFSKKAHSNFVFVSTAALIESKKVGLGVEAFAQVWKVYNDVCLEIIGAGPQQRELGILAQRLGIAEKVHFNGALPRGKIAEIYKRCDCFVLPSAFETFGVVYIEAMAAGLPVIATRCGGPEDFVTEENGILIDIDDVEGLKNAMLNMYLSRKQYDGSAIAENTAARFSASAVAKRILNIYNKVLDENGLVR